jgi:hypothetical protein
MNKLIFIALIMTLYFPASNSQSTESQSVPYGFRDDRLGMPIAQFKVKHPNPPTSSFPYRATCADAVKGVVWCTYGGASENIPAEIVAAFLDGKLAIIQVKPPTRSGYCFDPTETYFDSPSCKPYVDLRESLTAHLGIGTTLEASNHKELRAMRWENSNSIAELQYHMCGPWDGSSNGWPKAIQEILEGHYCGQGDSVSGMYVSMFYLDKEMSRTLAIRRGQEAK